MTLSRSTSIGVNNLVKKNKELCSSDSDSSSSDSSSSSSGSVSSSSDQGDIKLSTKINTIKEENDEEIDEFETNYKLDKNLGQSK